MLDIKFVRENPDAVKENIRKKFQDAKLPLVDEKLIAEHSLNVRQAEALCRKLAKDAKQAGQEIAPEPPPRPALPVEVEESLRQALGSEVSVAYKNGRGSLTVHFYSDDQLRAFANLLGHYDLEGTGPAPVDQALWEQT